MKTGAKTQRAQVPRPPEERRHHDTDIEEESNNVPPPRGTVPTPRGGHQPPPLPLPSNKRGQRFTPGPLGLTRTSADHRFPFWGRLPPWLPCRLLVIPQVTSVMCAGIIFPSLCFALDFAVVISASDRGHRLIQSHEAISPFWILMCVLIEEPSPLTQISSPHFYAFLW